MSPEEPIEIPVTEVCGRRMTPRNAIALLREIYEAAQAEEEDFDAWVCAAKADQS